MVDKWKTSVLLLILKGKANMRNCDTVMEVKLVMCGFQPGIH